MNWIFLILGMVIAYLSGTLIEIIGRTRKWDTSKIFIISTVVVIIIIVAGAAIITVFNL